MLKFLYLKKIKNNDIKISNRSMKKKIKLKISFDSKKFFIYFSMFFY